MNPKKILNANEISTILNRLSFQLIEDHNTFNDTVIIAIQPRGAILGKRISKLINRTKLKTFFYIPPKRWAYLQNRTKKMVGLIDHMLCILPFEKTFFERVPDLQDAQNRSKRTKNIPNQQKSDFAGFICRIFH